MNNDDQEYPINDRSAIAIALMQAIDVPEVPEDVIRSTAVEMREASRRGTSRNRVFRMAAAAVVALVLIGLAIVASLSGPAIALAEVAEQVKATKTLRAVVVDPREGGTLFASGTLRRYQGEHSVAIGDSATGQEIMLDVKNKIAYRSPKTAALVLDFYALFRDLGKAASTPINDYVDPKGQRYPGFSGSTTVKVGEKETMEFDAKVWVDPETKLPVRMEIRPSNAGETEARLIEQIEFDVALDDALFDMTIPADYKIVGLTPDQLKPPPSKEEAAKRTIVPGVGIGQVKFGMSRDEIVAILGEPEVVLHDTYLGYLSMGLQLVTGGPELDELEMIIANPGDAASNVRHEFPGQTDKGIRIGSSWQEVIDAYGQPDPPLPSTPAYMKLVGYEKLGLSFSFVEDKVAQIFVSRVN